MREFSIINKYFKPLTINFSGSLGLSDDAALLTPPNNCELVITKDALSQGIHFIGTEDPSLIAGKALRVNLSDLAAMGAAPICYFLALILPKDTSQEWLEKFTNGLKQTQEEFNISLAGGDTTATQGSLSISITAIGSVKTGTALRRNGAKAGDDIYVSGTLGDSALGLELLQNGKTDDNYLINRYLTPQPRIKLGLNLHGIANSTIDISDGLVQDLEHICTTSNVGATIYTDKIPLSNTALSFYNHPTPHPCHPALVAGSRATTNDGNCVPKPHTTKLLTTALTGGDDYELLFTASPNKKDKIKQLAKSLSLPLTCIGKISNNKNSNNNSVQIINENGKIIELSKKGFLHF